MNLSKTAEQIDNRKLSRLIIEHNKVNYDLIQINDFFKFYVGFNLISFFAFGITGVFILLLDIDWRFLELQMLIFDLFSKVLLCFQFSD